MEKKALSLKCRYAEESISRLIPTLTLTVIISRNGAIRVGLSLL